MKATIWRAALVAALALPATVVGMPIHFEGESSGTFLSDGQMPFMTVVVTHSVVDIEDFNFTSVASTQVVDFTQVPPAILDGSGLAAFSDSNGILYARYSGSFYAPAPGILMSDGVFSFLNGTGDYAWVSGGGTYHATVAFATDVAGTSTIEWNGVLNVPDTGSSLWLLLLSLPALLRRGSSLRRD